jgi:hypothetical protein
MDKKQVLTSKDTASQLIPIDADVQYSKLEELMLAIDTELDNWREGTDHADIFTILVDGTYQMKRHLLALRRELDYVYKVLSS